MNPSSCPIAAQLQLTRLDPHEKSDKHQQTHHYQTTIPPWHPPHARGIYGGAVVAQALHAAELSLPSAPATPPSPSHPFTPHSIHASFLQPGSPSTPIHYTVTLLRTGRSFCTSSVHATQNTNTILLAKVNFSRGGETGLEHGNRLDPSSVPTPPPRPLRTGQGDAKDDAEEGAKRPFERVPLPAARATREQKPEEKRLFHWIRAKNSLPDRKRGGADDDGISLAALVYLSDSNFVGTIPRVHDLGLGVSKGGWGDLDRGFPPAGKDADADADKRGKSVTETGKEVSMMVSLTHTVYFHPQPQQAKNMPVDADVDEGWRADEWLLAEMWSPWAAGGRGLVMQRIWTQQGRLVASCVQEGLVRLKRSAKL